MKLPKLNQANITGITASELLSSVLSEFSVVVPIPTEKDLGIDMRCELISKGFPTGLHYNIQCKGTEKCVEDRDRFSIQISVSTVNYWLQQREPTFLVVVDKENKKFYWLYPFELIKDRVDEIQKQDSVTFNVNKRNYFTDKIKSLPVEMINVIHEYHYNLFEKITKVLELEFIEKNNKLEQASPIEKYISISSSIEEVLKKVQMLENLNKNLVDRISSIVEKEVKYYRESISELDHIPEIRRYIKAASVCDDFGFMDGKTPSMIMDNVTDSWKTYKNSGFKSENLLILNKALDDLLSLNKNLAYFLYEMKTEVDPNGDHWYLIERFKM